MRFVLDASVAVKWVIDEPDSAIARRLRADVESGMHELLSRDLLSIELAHVLGKAEVVHRVVGRGAASLHLQSIFTTPMSLFETFPLLLPALSISTSGGVRCSVYDAVYVALAGRENATLVTADRRLQSSLGTMASVLNLAGY